MNEPATPVISRRNKRKRTKDTTTVDSTTTVAKKKQHVELEDDGVVVDGCYFTLNDEKERDSLLKKFSKFIVQVNTMKRRNEEITFDVLTRIFTDFTLNDLHMIVSILPQAFELYYPKQLIISQNLTSSGIPPLSIRILLPPIELYKVISQFQSLLSTPTTTTESDERPASLQFKYVELPQLPEHLLKKVNEHKAQQQKEQQQEQQQQQQHEVQSQQQQSTGGGVNHANKKNRLDMFKPKLKTNLNISNLENLGEVDETGDVLSAATRGILAENEQKQLIQKQMALDLKRRIELANILHVATLINTVLKVSERNRMKLEDLKKEVVNISLNKLTRADFIRYVELLVAMNQQKWCRIETLSFRKNEKILVIDEKQQTFVELKKIIEDLKSTDK